MVQRPLNNLAGERRGMQMLNSKLPEWYLQDETAGPYNAECLGQSLRSGAQRHNKDSIPLEISQVLNLYQCNLLCGNRLKIHATVLCAAEQKDHRKCSEGAIHTEGFCATVGAGRQFVLFRYRIAKVPNYELRGFLLVIGASSFY